MKTNEQILTENCTPELADFIRRENVVQEFCDNVRDDFNNGGAHPNTPMPTIGDAFWWDLTPQGDRFWRKLHEKHLTPKK